MAEEQKFDSEELAKIKDLQTKYQTITARLGQLEVDHLLLGQALDRLEESKGKLQSEYLDVQAEEKEFVTTLNTKYGAGNVDISTGIFTPAKPTK